MAHPLARIAAPLVIGAAAAAGAIVGSLIARDRAERTPIGAPQAPLAIHGWWDCDDSSPLAYAHPAVLFVDTASGTIVDSWDRRTRSRVVDAVARWSPEWPERALIVVDATSGDLLQTIDTTPRV